jgi:hypothetical protein
MKWPFWSSFVATTSIFSPVPVSTKWTVAVSHGAGVTPCCMTLNPTWIGVPSTGGVVVWASATMSAQPPAMTGTARISSMADAAMAAAMRRIIGGLLCEAGRTRSTLLPSYTDRHQLVPGTNLLWAGRRFDHNSSVITTRSSPQPS